MKKLKQILDLLNMLSDLAELFENLKKKYAAEAKDFLEGLKALIEESPNKLDDKILPTIERLIAKFK